MDLVVGIIEIVLLLIAIVIGIFFFRRFVKKLAMLLNKLRLYFEEKWGLRSDTAKLIVLLIYIIFIGIVLILYVIYRSIF